MVFPDAFSTHLAHEEHLELSCAGEEENHQPHVQKPTSKRDAASIISTDLSSRNPQRQPLQKKMHIPTGNSINNSSMNLRNEDENSKDKKLGTSKVVNVQQLVIPGRERLLTESVAFASTASKDDRTETQQHDTAKSMQSFDAKDSGHMLHFQKQPSSEGYATNAIGDSIGVGGMIDNEENGFHQIRVSKDTDNGHDSPAVGRNNLSKESEGAEGHGTNDGVDNESGDPLLDGAAEEDDDDWNRIVQEIEQDPESSSYQNLQTFMIGMEQRRTAQESLKIVWEESQEALHDIVNTVVQAIHPIHKEISDRMQDMEENLVQLMIDNHERRDLLKHRVEACNDAWISEYKRLHKSILGQDPCMHEAAEGRDKESSDIMVATIEGKHKPFNEHECSGGPGEKNPHDGGPNWEGLLADDVGRGRVKVFLQNRDRWLVMQEELDQAVAEIQMGLNACISQIEHAVMKTCDFIHMPLHQQQVDLQASLGSNFTRRLGLERAIQEAAEQQQGMFAKLMAKVANMSKKTPCAMSKK